MGHSRLFFKTCERETAQLVQKATGLCAEIKSKRFHYTIPEQRMFVVNTLTGITSKKELGLPAPGTRDKTSTYEVAVTFVLGNRPTTKRFKASTLFQSDIVFHVSLVIIRNQGRGIPK